MGDDGGQTDVQFVGNLFVDEPFGNERQHFYFAGGEVVVIGGVGGDMPLLMSVAVQP